MSVLVLKTVSGVAATCGLTGGKVLCKAILLIFTNGQIMVKGWLWLAIALVAHTLIWGSDEMIHVIAPWVLNASVLLLIFIAWTVRKDPAVRIPVHDYGGLSTTYI